MIGRAGLPRIAVALAVALVAALLGWARPARAQFFSPGPLARPHAGLEGLDRCAKCHDQGKGLAAKLCLDCHTELAGRVTAGAGFHGRLPAAKKEACESCHPDHRGRDFSMIQWEGGRDRFDHGKTGWPLRGAHTKAACDGCHQRSLVIDPHIRRLLDKQPRRATFLGAGTRCDGCHFDEHRGQLGRECGKCHQESAWKPAPSFDHQATDFALRGKHKEVACAKCHPSVTDDRAVAAGFLKPRSAAFLTMKPVEHRSCESCHQDPHKGSFGAACASCHSEAGWKIVKAASGRDSSFHDKTRFPLRGGHVGVACRSCHGPFPGQPARFKGLPFAACSDCHQDAHLGQLRPAPPAKVAACDGCHTVNAFVPARFELEQHQETKFPLEGAHGAAACRGCHPVDPKLAARITPALHKFLRARKRPELFSLAVLHPRKVAASCLGCHDDVHRGQLARRAKAASPPQPIAGGAEPSEGSALAARGDDKDNCHTCHGTQSFHALTFDHDKDSRFPLTGKHADAACGSCHKPERAGTRGPAVVRYRPLDTACASCHADPHQGQFLLADTLGRERTDRRPAGARGCDFCHDTRSFQKTTFDHGDPKFTTFDLDGKHARVACGRCHPTVALGGRIQTVRYRPLPRACEECHTDFHHGEFRGFEP